MNSKNGATLTRRSILGAFAGVSTLAAAPAYANIFGFLKGAGDVRRLKMYSQRTGEMIDTIYWIEGEYIAEALGEIVVWLSQPQNQRDVAA